MPQVQLETVADAQAKADGALASAHTYADTGDTTERNRAIAQEALRELLANKGQANGYASLDSTGKVPVAQMSSIVISDFLGNVASQAAMLALVGQRGDWCIRTDTPVVNGVAQASTWILNADDASVLSNWVQLPTPADTVVSVNGRTGPVSGLAEATDLATETANRAAAITGEANSRIAGDALAIPLTQRGAINGVPTLDGGGKIPDGQIPDGITRDTELSAAIAALVAAAPGTLDTLNELATALGDDPNFATTITTLIGTKAPQTTVDADLAAAMARATAMSVLF